ncbi:MAG: alpha/beta fold hydrolase [Pseudomonadales bacterium]
MSYEKVSLRTLILSLALTMCSVTTVFAATTSLTDVDHEEITIWSQGIRLAGDIYKPKGLKDNDTLPGILLVPGWGGNKNNLQKNFGPQFAVQGFIVLAFDYKGWGESDGPLVAVGPLPAAPAGTVVSVQATQIRQVVDPLSMSQDVRAALQYLGGEPQVMPDNLGIWGTSLGGGLALVAAQNDDRIKAFVTQMGPVNYQFNLREIPDLYVRNLEAQVARGERPPFPGPEGTPNPELKGYPDWTAFKRFNPLANLDNLQAPTLIIDAENETLFQREKNGLLLYETIKDRLDSKYVVYPGAHYDMYEGENLEAARYEASQWFIKYLKNDSADAGEDASN